MRIAVASSGLGSIARGIEAWAADTAQALARRGLDVTLFAGGDAAREPHEARRSRKRERPEAAYCALETEVLPCWQRGKRMARLAARVMPGLAWRWGVKAPYGWEQLTFWLRLAPRLRAGRYDILHVQDPMLAYWCSVWRHRGWLKTKEILAHGTEETFEFLRQFQYVQELAPYYLERDKVSFDGGGVEARSEKSEVSDRGPAESVQSSVSSAQAAGVEPALRVLHTADQASGLTRKWFSVPNFVDTVRFSPSVMAIPRSELGIPEDAFVILCVSAIKRTHKRVDVVIDAVKRLRSITDRSSGLRSLPSLPIRLVVVGAWDPETEEVMAHGRQQLGPWVEFLRDVPRDRMPGLYRMANLMLHGSLVEMMPIALLEAMASGVPVVAHRWPVVEWVVGRGGTCLDATHAADLAAAVQSYQDPALQLAAGVEARKRVATLFSEDVVVTQILDLYEEVLAGK